MSTRSAKQPAPAKPAAATRFGYERCPVCGLPLDAAQRKRRALAQEGQTMWRCEACGLTAWGADDFGEMG